LGPKKKCLFVRSALIKVRLRLAVAELYRSLVTGGHCSEVAVKVGWIVYKVKSCLSYILRPPIKISAETGTENVHF
jgi:hypothetical protein